MPRPSPQAYRVLWKYQRRADVIEGRVMAHPHGHRFELAVNDWVLWSQLFPDGQGILLGELAESTRRSYRGNGWHELRP